MLASPVPERRLELLRELLRVLLERGAVAVLLSLPLAGTADVPHGDRCACPRPPPPPYSNICDDAAAFGAAGHG